MIQRIQTVYLVAGSLILASSYLMSDVWTGAAAQASAWFTPLTLGLYSLSIAGGILAVFLYKTRDRQQTLILLILSTALLGWLAQMAGLFIAGVVPGVHADAGSSALAYGAVAVPLVSAALFHMARKGVQKDIALLKSVDRLR